MELKDLIGRNAPVSLTALGLSKDLVVLCLCPHPDDFDAIGVTLRHFRDNGNLIHALVLRTGSGVEDSYCSSPDRELKAAVREKEQRASCRFFGLPDERLTFMDLREDENQAVIEDGPNLARIREHVFKIRPDIVFLPHGNDTNTGHRRVYSMLAKMAKAADFTLTAFLIKDPKTIRIRIDAYTGFGRPDAEWKAQLLRFHDTQHQRNLHSRGIGFDERILEVNRKIASELDLGYEFAEAFEISPLSI